MTRSYEVQTGSCEAHYSPVTEYPEISLREMRLPCTAFRMYLVTLQTSRHAQPATKTASNWASMSEAVNAGFSNGQNWWVIERKGYKNTMVYFSVE